MRAIARGSTYLHASKDSRQTRAKREKMARAKMEMSISLYREGMDTTRKKKHTTRKKNLTRGEMRALM